MDSLKSVATSRTSSTDVLATRREVIIEVEGAFGQLQASLSQLRNQSSGFEIASITMSEANTRSPLRLWKLRVIV